MFWLITSTVVGEDRRLLLVSRIVPATVKSRRGRYGAPWLSWSKGRSTQKHEALRNVGANKIIPTTSVLDNQAVGVHYYRDESTEYDRRELAEQRIDTLKVMGELHSIQGDQLYSGVEVELAS